MAKPTKTDGKKPEVRRLRVQDEFRFRQLELTHRFMIWDRAFALAGVVVRWAGVVASLYFVYLSTTKLAGTRTEAIFNLVARLSLDRWAGWAVSAVLGGTVVVQRRANRRLAREKGDYVKELEQRIDLKRSSSRLTPTGTSPPEDADGT